jgi:hypothetical protein
MIFPLPPPIHDETELVMMLLSPPKIAECLESSSIRFFSPPAITVLDESMVVLSDPPPINDCTEFPLIEPAQFVLPQTTVLPSPSA